MHTITLPRDLFNKFAGCVEHENQTETADFWRDGPGSMFNLGPDDGTKLRDDLNAALARDGDTVSVTLKVNAAAFARAAFEVASEEQELLPDTAQTTEEEWSAILAALPG